MVGCWLLSRPYGTHRRCSIDTLGVGTLTALSGLSAHLQVLCATAGALAYSVRERDNLVAQLLAAPGSQEEVVYHLGSGYNILDLLGLEWSITVNRLSAVLHYHGLCIRTVTRYEQWTVR